MATSMGGGYYAAPPEVSLSWISEGWDLYTQEWGTWSLTTFIAWLFQVSILVLAMLPTGMMAAITSSAQNTPGQLHNPFLTGLSGIGPAANIGINMLSGAFQVVVMGGFFRMALRQVREGHCELSDFFSIGDVILPLLTVGAITAVAGTLAIYLLCFPTFIVHGLFMFAPLLVVDRRAGGLQAIGDSVNMLKGSVWMAAAFYFVGTLVMILGALACCV
ncbi:MAG: hypothetical protein ACLQVD_16035, partial [Capsulimonadaceae bacterium]